MMWTMLKAGCLAIYAVALAAWAGWLPAAVAGAVAGPVQTLALALLAIHALELVFVFRHVRSYRGPLAISVLLALLFGLLHWKPLMDGRARE
jgi:hypothetical protein